MLKSKSKIILSLLILCAIALFIINPSVCMQSTLNGLKIWLFNVVPALFPFFVLTRLISNLNTHYVGGLDKFTYRLFRTKNAGLIYPLSILSGYPVGAKLISNYYEMGAIDKNSATKMFSFCSTSGPMFIIGTVGIGIFCNAKVGYILLIGHIIGSLLNGLLYRGKKGDIQMFSSPTPIKANSDIMYDSIISILLVGGYIVFASVIIEILTLSNILPAIASFISKIPCFDYDIIYAFLCGLIEMTNGLIMLNSTSVALSSQIILSSILIAFSGICVMLQSIAFLNKIGISKRTMIIQKLTQTLFTALATIALVLIIY